MSESPNNNENPQNFFEGEWKEDQIGFVTAERVLEGLLPIYNALNYVKASIVELNQRSGLGDNPRNLANMLSWAEANNFQILLKPIWEHERNARNWLSDLRKVKDFMGRYEDEINNNPEYYERIKTSIYRDLLVNVLQVKVVGLENTKSITDTIKGIYSDLGIPESTINTLKENTRYGADGRWVITYLYQIYEEFSQYLLTGEPSKPLVISNKDYINNFLNGNIYFLPVLSSGSVFGFLNAFMLADFSLKETKKVLEQGDLEGLKIRVNQVLHSSLNPCATFTQGIDTKGIVPLSIINRFTPATIVFVLEDLIATGSSPISVLQTIKDSLVGISRYELVKLLKTIIVIEESSSKKMYRYNQSNKTEHEWVELLGVYQSLKLK